MSMDLMRAEPNLCRMEAPCVIVGDIHGQFYDLCNMLERVGSPDVCRYVFLGDYVDRGIFGVEVVLLLCCMKLRHPREVALLRGNHESRSMTESFTFRQEVLDRYADVSVYEAFLELFKAMPLACIVDGSYLCMHGGISPSLQYISEINKIDRFVEVPLRGALCDLLWADQLKDCEAVRGEFWPNKERDCSVYFGKKPTKKFLHVNKLTCVVRGHQVNVEGYKMHKWDGPNCAPLVITVFSAPNYCGYYDNKAAILYLNSNSKLSVR